MKPLELKEEYVVQRASGESYSAIAKKLNISKSTCYEWDKELSAQITELKQASIRELYESYGMAKEQRIKRIGDTLEIISNALRNPLAVYQKNYGKLLDAQLKYMEALKNEMGSNEDFEVNDASGIMRELTTLLNRAKNGDITQEQLNSELSVIGTFLKAYEVSEVSNKLNTITDVINRVQGEEQNGY